ncbi:MAG: sodium:alanine symporter family protein [Gemmatimonadales bacterium]|nr:sodium:alanine symporter family protein [Gemmatimonadales bacterium]
MDFLNNFASGLAGTVWGWPEVFPVMVAALLITGLFTTISLRFIQLRKLKHSLDVVRGKYDDPSHEGDLSHFQALTTALSATVGIGNIAGVATAIHYGGPGALFWMWVTAVFGMALKYAECTLAIKYRQILPDGSASGGPMYYIEKGLGKNWKPLAVAFAVCAVISSFGSGNSIQAFTVADQIRSDLGVSTWITGLISASLVALVILGGIKRIGAVTSKLVPYMAVIYVVSGALILLLNLSALPGAITSIFASAFKPAAQVGGFAGGTFIFMLTWGVKRGLFSNESGQGSAPIAHAAAKTDEPVREGVVAMMGPLIDTLIICSITGLVILSTGAWRDKVADSVPVNTQSALTVIQENAQVLTDGKVSDEMKFTGEVECLSGRPQGVFMVRNHSLVEMPVFSGEDGTLFEGILSVEDGDIQTDELAALTLSGHMAQNGSPLTAMAFKRGLSPFGDWGHLLITLSVVLFGISTAISWSYYGDRAVVYLFGPKFVFPYKIIFCVMNFLGAIFTLEVVWNFGDSALGLMALPNLIALIFLAKKVRGMTGEYFSRDHKPYR